MAPRAISSKKLLKISEAMTSFLPNYEGAASERIGRGPLPHALGARVPLFGPGRNNLRGEVRLVVVALDLDALRLGKLEKLVLGIVGLESLGLGPLFVGQAGESVVASA